MTLWLASKLCCGDEHERAYEVSACGGREQPHRSGMAVLPYQPCTRLDEGVRRGPE